MFERELKEIERSQDHKLGEKLIDLLNLKRDRDGYIKTSWGTKTAYGLALTVKRIIEETNE